MSGFRFDGDYRNGEQVAPYFDAYMAVWRELDEAGRYPYNARFEGRIPGISGSPDEGRAIYMLQQMRLRAEMRQQVDALLADGWDELALEALTDEPTRFAGVAHYGWYMGGTGFEVISTDKPRLLRWHRSVAYMKKGARTRGCVVDGTILVKR